MTTGNRTLLVLAALLMLSTPAFTQRESGKITGSVTDPSGAVIAKAKVTVTSVAEGVSRSTITNAAGEYAITYLKPDIYEVTIEAEKFQKVVQKVEVTVGSVNELSVKLPLATASTTVEVSEEAGAVMVNTETPTLSDIVSAETINQLPTLDRNPYDLVATAGNINSDPSARGVGYAINGQRSASTDILLDGGENVDTFSATVGQAVPLDSVQEFSVVTSNYTAEYGRASGGVVNLTTKSGTNNFHGSVYEYNRISAFTAQTYQNDAARAFECVKGQPCSIGDFAYTRNQFGYSVGGPIKKNKLFFFNNTEWTRVRSQGTTTTDIIDPAFLTQPGVSPNTAAFFAAYGQLKSNVQVLSHINYGQATGTTSGPCPGNFPCSAPFAEQIQYSANADAGGGEPQNQYQSVARIDYTYSDKTNYYARYAIQNIDEFPGTVNSSPYAGPTGPAGYDTGEFDRNQNFTLNMVHVFRPNLVSSSKVVYNRLSTLDPLGANPVSPTLYENQLGVASLPGSVYGIVFPGYSEFTPGNAIPFGGPQNLVQFYQDLEYIRGKHEFRFGGNYINLRDDRVFGAYEEAVEALAASGLGTNSSAFTNLISGNIYQYSGAVYPQGVQPCYAYADGSTAGNCTISLPATSPTFSRLNHFNDGALYAQDAYKVIPRLTVTLGVRWEYYGPQHNGEAQCVTPSGIPNGGGAYSGPPICGDQLQSNFFLNGSGPIWEQIRNGQVRTGNLWNPDYKDFAPRAGFAWDVFGDGKTSLRGGYGISYERNFGNVTYNVIQNPPNYGVVDITSVPSTGAPLPIYVNNFGPLAGTGTALLPAVELRAVNPNIKSAYSEMYSLSIDRQIARQTVASVGYAGSRGIHLYSIEPYNLPYSGGQVDLYPGFVNAAGQPLRSGYLVNDPNTPGGGCSANNLDRLQCQFGSINFRGSDGIDNYNALTASVKSNNLWGKGLHLTANYTYSHTLDDLSSTFSEGGNGNYQLGYEDPFNPRHDYGNAEYDARHRLSLSGVWDVPFWKNSSSPLLRQLLGGWNLSPIYIFQSGLPYSVYDCYWGVYDCPRYAPGVGIPLTGSPTGTGQPNVFNWLGLPVNTSGPFAGLPVGEGNALEIPACSANFGVGCVYSMNGALYAASGFTFTTPGPPETQRNQFRGPDNWTFNFAVNKDFRVTERVLLTLRSDVLNILNHHNYYINEPGADTLGLTNGEITAVKGGFGTPSDERRLLTLTGRVTF